MVDSRASAALDRTFRALASGPRREILRRVATLQRTVTELAEQFDMSLAAVSKHVQVLARAELITIEPDGRRHWCRLNPKALEPARASIDELRAFWNEQLEGLAKFLSKPQSGSARRRTKP